MQDRAARHAPDAPLSIYEMHLASWMWPTHDPGASTMWDLAIDRLIPYLTDMGFTHVELLPITEHPFGGSWGYQPLGLFAPTGRFGSPEGFARFVDRAHMAGLGVILDWVPAHFPTDSHGLARFDGTALYEHLDPREGFHRDWNTYIYNFGRREVQGFLIASALHWLEHFHVDGLLVHRGQPLGHVDHDLVAAAHCVRRARAEQLAGFGDDAMRVHVDGPDALAADRDRQFLTRSLRVGGGVQHSATAEDDAGGSGDTGFEKVTAGGHVESSQDLSF
jgi:1,4-alpha-glucan branching enzyme